jgi:UDP:flavonoid glycosyltransferase YjiC (YdhE family)
VGPDGAPRIAAFVSPHGYGHAARASAVLTALQARCHAGVEVFTTVPRWFFEESLLGPFGYHEVDVDVGFRQASALRADLAATAAALDALVPFDERLIDDLAALVTRLRCSGVLCDIAPLGVAVAERAGLPSVLVESFTWPWLYEPYYGDEPGLRAPARILDEWRARATRIVQTEPLCARDPATTLVGPISRPPRLDRAAARASLGIPGDRAFVAITMGGYDEEMPFLDRLRALDDVTFLVTGQHATRSDGNLRLVSNRTPIFMPDLLRAADAVVAKLGYGILAEVWREGVPYGFVSRPGFPEMPALEAFARDRLGAHEIDPGAWASGAWVEALPGLIVRPRTPREGTAADQVARLVHEVAGS